MTQQNALVVVMSDIQNDPRVRREIQWLSDDGWVVDSLGLGDHPTEDVRDHFVMLHQAKWVQSRIGSLLIYLLLPNRLRFRLLTEDRIPSEVERRVRGGEYRLIVFNDREIIPWVRNRRTFSRSVGVTLPHIHLDLHEYFVPRIRRDSVWRTVASGYHKWVRAIIADPIFASRSVVAAGIADLYASELGIPTPAVVRNSPPFVDQEPSHVDPSRIELIHHGLAHWDRGLREMVDSMRIADQRFRLTLMLANDDVVAAAVANYASDLGDRVRVVPAVPMTELSTAVNRYDLEVVFFPPVTRNLEFALPNKLFEAVQGRLGLVVGESRMMVEVVESARNGVVVTGWGASDLARALNSLTTDQIIDFKSASHSAARQLCAEEEARLFLETVVVRAVDTN